MASFSVLVAISKYFMTYLIFLFFFFSHSVYDQGEFTRRHNKTFNVSCVSIFSNKTFSISHLVKSALLLCWLFNHAVNFIAFFCTLVVGPRTGAVNLVFMKRHTPTMDPVEMSLAAMHVFSTPLEAAVCFFVFIFSYFFSNPEWQIIQIRRMFEFHFGSSL